MVTLLNWSAALVLMVQSMSPDHIPSRAHSVQHRDAVPQGPTEGDLEAEFKRARDLLRVSPEFQGDSADTHYRLAKTLHHRGDLNGAAEEYRLAVQRNPRFVEAYRDLGVLLLDYHDYAGAVAALEQALRLGQGDGATYYWLGLGFMGLGDWTAAATALRTATRLNPDDAEAYADLGLVQMVQGDVTGATESLRTSIELKPDNADAHARLETITANQADRRQVMSAAKKIITTLFGR
jgi:tetratricopeptide (TPR) repeat protein